MVKSCRLHPLHIKRIDEKTLALKLTRKEFNTCIRYHIEYSRNYKTHANFIDYDYNTDYISAKLMPMDRFQEMFVNQQKQNEFFCSYVEVEGWIHISDKGMCALPLKGEKLPKVKKIW